LIQTVADRAVRLLVVSGQSILSPEDGGGSKRQWHVIKGCERNGLDVTVWSIDPTPLPPIEGVGQLIRADRQFSGRARVGKLAKLQALVSPLPEEIWARPLPSTDLIPQIADHDVVLFMQPSAAQLLSAVIAASKPAVLDQHDVVSQAQEFIAATLPGRVARWRTRLDARKWRGIEPRILDSCDLVTAVSEGDAQAFRAISKTPVVVRPNGVDVTTFTFVDHARAEGARLLMTGHFGYLPNIDAARWLTNEIMPRLRSTRPDVTLRLVGRSAPAGPWPEGVSAIADVPEIQPWFDNADLFIVPMRAGGGTRIKIVEAMAKGLPTVTTRVGAEGLPIEDGVHLLLADTTDELVAAVLRLMGDAELRARLASNGRRLVEEQLGWNRITDDYATDILALARPR
jgi:glycosyltransferase involved in cell wall biosynthesis